MFDSILTQKGMELAEHLLNLTVYIFSLKDTYVFVAFYFSSLSAISLICIAVLRIIFKNIRRHKRGLIRRARTL